MKRANGKTTAPKLKRPDDRVYTLEVFLTDAPASEEFVERNPVISRKIEILGGQTLADLHRIIFKAYDREEEHLYEFQFGEGPHDPEGDRYVLPEDIHSPFPADRPPAGLVTDTTIDALNLEIDRAFGYWFDFGDDWFHQIDVIAVGEKEPRRRYPRVTGRVGKSPPQYPDWYKK